MVTLLDSTCTVNGVPTIPFELRHQGDLPVHFCYYLQRAAMHTQLSQALEKKVSTHLMIGSPETTKQYTRSVLCRAHWVLC